MLLWRWDMDLRFVLGLVPIGRVAKNCVLCTTGQRPILESVNDKDDQGDVDAYTDPKPPAYT